MDVAYWDAMSAAFDEEIFDSLKEDRRGVIRDAIIGVAGPRKRVLDLGCGVGRYLPLLSGAFREVQACDWSPGCVRSAQKVAESLPNVTVRMSKAFRGREWSGKFDAITAINVLFDPLPRRRSALLKDIRRLLSRRGSAVIVVPSLEAVVYAEAIRRAHAPRTESVYEFGVPESKRDAGILQIQGVPYKHYVGEELIHALRHAGFRPGALKRVEYPWQTEVAAPPRRYGVAAPWDWLIVARRD